MKPSILFACCLSLIATPALAALDANQCYAKSAKLKQSERSAYIESCMKQVSSSANVNEIKQKNKSATCAQNAKNRHLQGNARNSYISSCMRANEAASAARLTSSQTTMMPHHIAEKTARKRTSSPARKSTGRNRDEKSCAQRAIELKGDERKRFMKRCQQD